jgi:hypothetical protein
MSRPRFRRLVARVAIVAWSVGLVLPAFGRLHVPDFADGEGSESLLTPGHPVTQVEPVYPALADEHCAICHFHRILRGSVLQGGATPVPLESLAAERVLDQRRLPAASLFALPPRAPPLAFSSLS